MHFHDGCVYSSSWVDYRTNGTAGTLKLPGWGTFQGSWTNGQIRINTTLAMSSNEGTLMDLL